MTQRDYFEKDYYAILGVPKDAPQAEIGKAYRKLARELHPDVRPDDESAEARFKEIGEAYAVLSNPEKRREYDQVREMVASGRFAGFSGAGGSPGAAGFAGFGGNFGGAQATFDLNDILGNLFQQGSGTGASGAGMRARRQATGQRGKDLQTDVTLSFADAMAGVTTTLRIGGRAQCSTCGGSGARPGTHPRTCSTCGGSGVLTRDQGLFGFSEPCTTCGGSGRVIPDPCPTCDGSGAEVRTREVRARIPAGVKDGARIRLKGKGEAGVRGGPPGDLYVNINVEPHELFGRSGDNLTLRVPVTFPEAALGARITVPTLDEPVTLKVPAGTESGRTFRVRGRGVPKASGGAGDLLITVDVAVPRKLTRTQRKLVEDFAATTDPEELRRHLDAVAPRGG
jgi:molecular chaperone DnaJ